MKKRLFKLLSTCLALTVAASSVVIASAESDRAMTTIGKSADDAIVDIPTIGDSSDDDVGTGGSAINPNGPGSDNRPIIPGTGGGSVNKPVIGESNADDRVEKPEMGEPPLVNPDDFEIEEDDKISPPPVHEEDADKKPDVDVPDDEADKPIVTPDDEDKDDDEIGDDDVDDSDKPNVPNVPKPVIPNYVTNKPTTGSKDAADYISEYEDVVTDKLGDYDVDVNVVYSMIQLSDVLTDTLDALKSFNNVGGIIPISETAFEFVKELLGETDVNLEDMKDLETNVLFVIVYLDYLNEKYADTNTALAVYFAGEELVAEWLSNPEYSSDGITLDVIPDADISLCVETLNEFVEAFDAEN